MLLLEGIWNSLTAETWYARLFYTGTSLREPKVSMGNMKCIWDFCDDVIIFSANRQWCHHFWRDKANLVIIRSRCQYFTINVPCSGFLLSLVMGQPQHCIFWDCTMLNSHYYVSTQSSPSTCGRLKEHCKVEKFKLYWQTLRHLKVN